MSKTGGLGDYFMIAGYDVSGDVGSLDQIGGGPNLGDVTAIKESAHERLGLIRFGNMQFTTWFNPATATDTEHSALSTLPRTDVIGTYLHQAFIGNPTASCNAKQINYDATRGNDGSLSFKADLEANGFGTEWGIQLTAGIQTDTTATSNNYVDNGGASTNGAQAYLQVAKVVGTSATIKVQHSTDHVTWNDLITFTTVNAGSKGQQRLAVSGTVNQYVRAISTGTFTSCIYAVMFNRNKVAVSF